MTLSLEQALEAYARMLNTGNLRHIKPILADGLRFGSQSVLEEMTGKEQFLRYMSAKLDSMAKAGLKIHAEMGAWSAHADNEPCVILAQGDRNNLVAVATGEVIDGKLCSLHVSIVPSPWTAKRSGRYPL